LTTVTENCAGKRTAAGFPSFDDRNSGNYAIVLPPGAWSVAVGYRPPFTFGQPLPPLTIGPTTSVTIVAEGTTTTNLTVAYSG
jgi:hypothetical protein